MKITRALVVGGILGLVLGFHALEEVLECLDLAGDREPATVIEPELLLDLLEQDLEERVL